MPYWHLTEPNSILLNNAFLAKGVVVSASLTAMTPGLEGITTAYAVLHVDRDKEQLWESVRTQRFAAKPSRLKSLYLFDDRAVAERLNEQWFNANGKRRVLVEAEILPGAVIHRADAKWLEAVRADWDSNAKHYWAGDMSPVDSKPEILVHGAVYFPGWQTEPFGIIRPQPPAS